MGEKCVNSSYVKLFTLKSYISAQLVWSYSQTQSYLYSFIISCNRDSHTQNPGMIIIDTSI